MAGLATPANRKITATSMERYPVEHIALLQRIGEQIKLRGKTPDLKLARDLVRAGILDALIRFQNCDVLPNAVDFEGKPLVRDIKNPPIVLRYYSEEAQYKNGVFITKENIKDILGTTKTANFCCPKVKALIETLRSLSQSDDMDGIKKAITEFHTENANPEFDYGVIGTMIGRAGANPTVDVPLMFEVNGALFERGGSRPGTGMLCFIGGFDEGGALKNMFKELVEEGLSIAIDNLKTTNNPEARIAAEKFAGLRDYLAKGAISIDVNGLTPEHQATYRLAEELFGIDSKLMFLVTLMREAFVIAPDSLTGVKRIAFEALMKKHADIDGKNLTPAGKLLFISQCEPELQTALLQKLVGNGVVLERGSIPNQDLGSSSAWKTGQFNGQFFAVGELDAVLKNTPHIKFAAGDDIIDLKNRMVCPELNNKSFDSHGLIRLFNMAAILTHKVSQSAPQSTAAWLFTRAKTVLKRVMKQQYDEMLDAYRGREKELSPQMRRVYSAAVRDMDRIIQSTRPPANDSAPTIQALSAA